MPLEIRSLTEHEAAGLLAEYGLPVLPGREAFTVAEALAAADVLGYPVACKVSSPDVAHKSDAGGVHLSLADEAALRNAVGELATRFPGQPVLVQPMAPPGVELIVGARRDPTFGPVVAVGAGGLLVELVEVVALRVCPIDEAKAHAMLAELPVGLLDGARGRPIVDRNTVVRIICDLARLMDERPDLLELECNPVIAGPAGAVAVDALARIASPMEESEKSQEAWPRLGDVAGFFAPSSVAVVGASEKAGKGGAVVLRNMLTHDFAGETYAVHPSADTVQGVPAFPSVAALPTPVELVVAVVPKAHIPQVVRECGERGVGNLIVVSGGFIDVGDASAEAEVATLARQARVRLMGPNSIGTIDTTSGVVTSITSLGDLSAGRAAYVGQTGVFASGFAAMNAPMRRVACLGNKADVCESDLLDYYGKDDGTAAIGCYIEGVARPRLFPAALREACAAKPVVLLTSGRSEAGAAAVASHTGAVVGDQAVFDAAARQAGAVMVSDFAEMFDCTEAFAMVSVPRGNGVGVVSISGVGCVLSADHAEQVGVRLPPLKASTEAAIRGIVPSWAPVRNPVDIWSAIEARGAESAYETIARAVLSQEDVHLLSLIFVWIPESYFDLPQMARRLRSDFPDKPILATFLGGPPGEVEAMRQSLRDVDVPTFPSIGRVMRVIAALEQRRRWLETADS